MARSGFSILGIIAFLNSRSLASLRSCVALTNGKRLAGLVKSGRLKMTTSRSSAVLVRLHRGDDWVIAAGVVIAAVGINRLIRVVSMRGG